MASPSPTITITGFLTIEALTNAYDQVTGGKFVKVTQGAPALENNQRAIRLSVTVPRAVFTPIADVAVDVPETLVLAPEVTVAAIE